MTCKKCNTVIPYRDIVPPGWHMFAPELYATLRENGQLCKRCAQERADP